MPERSMELHRQLGVSEPAALPVWDGVRRYTVTAPTPLFPRLDEDRRKELLARWLPARATAPAASSGLAPTTSATPAAPAAPARSTPTAPSPEGQVTYEEFSRLDLRVARVVGAEAVPKAKKLLKLAVDVGEERPRQVIAGIAERYSPETILGKTVIFLANLQPATIRGVLSEGMILAAGDAEIVALSGLDAEAAPGTKVR
jgi:methionyl-tRNA synthetase